MSEYQTSDSLERLLADANVEGGGAPLIASVRKDRSRSCCSTSSRRPRSRSGISSCRSSTTAGSPTCTGRTADFRRCVIILTSNVGSSIAERLDPRLRARRRRVFRPEQVERALPAHFRPEFLNRLDRVVVFRPFERAQMRALLDKELADVTQRRGWRGRPWAVELDESAIAFLIEQGFSPELGARPLKRAVERHLLAPLARAIVAGNVPEGEQFLFVTAPQDELEVTFVDPDADDEVADERGSAEPTETAARQRTYPDVRSLVVHPRTRGRSRPSRRLSALLRRSRATKFGDVRNVLST